MSDWSNKSEYRRMVIMDRSQNPHNFLTELQASKMASSYVKLQSASSSCTDNFDIYLQIKDDVVTDAKFVGEGCVISMTTTDFLLEKIVNQKVSDAQALISAYIKMIESGTTSNKIPEDLLIFDEVYKQANRIPCASNSGRIILNYLQGKK